MHPARIMDKPPVPSERENGLAETVPNREKPEQMPQVLVAFSKVFRLLKSLKEMNY